MCIHRPFLLEIIFIAVLQGIFPYSPSTSQGLSNQNASELKICPSKLIISMHLASFLLSVKINVAIGSSKSKVVSKVLPLQRVKRLSFSQILFAVHAPTPTE